MKRRKLFCILCALLMMLLSIPAYSVSAEEAEQIELTFEDGGDIAAGLISGRYLHITAGMQKIYLSAYTSSLTSMAHIGFKEIYIQRSSSSTGTFTSEKYIGDDYDSGTYYGVTNQMSTVQGGYYYRVMLKHYAKEYGSSPQTEYITNYSNAVWVPAG